MQVILIQVEIEEAIRRFVAAQINPREGMRIDVELKATRGDAGYQAFIDILEETDANADVDTKQTSTPSKAAVLLETAAAATPAAAVTPKPTSTGKTAASPVRTTVRKANPPVPAEPPVQEEPAAEEAQQADEVVEEQSIVDMPDADPRAMDQGEDTVGVEDEAPAAPVRSLFGGLTRPTNK